MLKCIAIDDEPLALQKLKIYISKIPYLELVATCHNALEAQQLLAGQAVDLIFLDINLPDLNGVDFVRTLHERPMVIFTTAYSEYAVEGFRLDAIDYLLKPYSFADFSRSAAKAQSLYELLHRPRTTGSDEETEALPKDREYISVKADYKVSLVRIADIVYLESEGEYVRMHLADGSTITTLFRLKNMEIGYTFRIPGVPINNIRVYANGYNLLTFTSFKANDPEAQAGFGSTRYPMTRVFNFGVNLNF